MSEYKVGDRFYIIATDNHILRYRWIELVSEYKLNSKTSPTCWHILWERRTDVTGTIRYSELKALKLFGSKLVQIKNDKHLLALQLKYG